MARVLWKRNGVMENVTASMGLTSTIVKVKNTFNFFFQLSVFIKLSSCYDTQTSKDFLDKCVTVRNLILLRFFIVYSRNIFVK